MAGVALYLRKKNFPVLVLTKIGIEFLAVWLSSHHAFPSKIKRKFNGKVNLSVD